MIRVLLKERLLVKSVAENKVISLMEVAEATGIGRATITRIASSKDYNATIKVVDKLCDYFECDINDLLVREPNKSVRISEHP